ncbi:putative FAD/NAD(P)-binding domain-containing protein [Seiridium unicorne]|uniref:FAD/NAD(P)-binding domain-containing protein n=1 Tax=Seiridium unicorne TaxID=138068 RepID=A0ABR2UJU4_9PEZI
MPFRIIVVGGGVTGLTASLCFQKAGIDHVVLERRDVVAPDEGASIAIYPHGARVLQQLGCLEAAKNACVPCDRWIVRMPDGKKIMDSGYFRYLEENHGSGMLLLERREFLQILYDGLPDKSHIRTSSPVKDIRHFADRVEVTLSNGEVEMGDMVLGCDGVHSVVRALMWDHANKSVPGLITVREKTAYKTRWKSLIGMAPAVPELGERDLTVVYNPSHSFLALAQPEKVFFFFIVRVDEPYTWPHRARYTDQDAEALAGSLAQHAVSNSLTFGELWKRRVRGGLVSLEEGVLDHWHHGRIVLAGDSAHKVTPSIALGGNSGMESVIVLCNHLCRAIGAESKPSAATLTKVFDDYQAERHERMMRIMELSSLTTKVQAWDGWWHKFLATWVLPLQPDRALADQIGEIIRTAPSLDIADGTSKFPSGRLPWNNEEATTAGLALEHVQGDKRNGLRSLLLPSFGAAAGFLVLWQGIRMALTPGSVLAASERIGSVVSTALPR